MNEIELLLDDSIRYDKPTNVDEEKDFIDELPFFSIDAENEDGNGQDSNSQTVVQHNIRKAPVVIHATPNHELTHEQRLEKRNLKKKLKQHSRLRKFEIRLHQAIARKDIITEQRARRELRDYCQSLLEQDVSILRDPQCPQQFTRDCEDSTYAEASRAFVERIYQQLILKCKKEEARLDKELLTEQARQLLLNMTKGTQTKTMFDNSDALLGYTRQKFIERAALAVSSLDQLKRPVSSNSFCSTNSLLTSLLSVGRVYSIGCGPGCDAVGVLAFFKSHHRPLQRIVLMDYVMDQWKQLVVDPLMEVLIPTHVPKINTASCDVRFSLHDETNRDAFIEIRRNEDCAFDISTDLVVISYLLTETRGKWQTFLGDVVNVLRPGSLLLMSEPTAWQLHHFLEFCRDHIEYFEWLDSSRWTPELQALEGRIGPAVLLVRTK